MTRDGLLNRFDDILNEYVSELDLEGLHHIDEEATLVDATADFKHLSMKTGGRCNARQRFYYWSPIEQPTFERLIEQTEEE